MNNSFRCPLLGRLGWPLSSAAGVEGHVPQIPINEPIDEAQVQLPGSTTKVGEISDVSVCFSSRVDSRSEADWWSRIGTGADEVLERSFRKPRGGRLTHVTELGNRDQPQGSRHVGPLICVSSTTRCTESEMRNETCDTEKREGNEA